MNTSQILLSAVAAAALFATPASAQNAAAESATAPAAGSSAAGPVGISARDGISFAAPDVLVTRNGVTETLKKEMQLANGTRVMPDGAVHLPDKGKITLRPNQVLTFDGKLIDAPAAAGSGQAGRGGAKAGQSGTGGGSGQ